MLIIWTTVNINKEINLEYRNTWNYQRAVDITDSLFDTQGDPLNWNYSNVITPGLASSTIPNSIDYNKIITLREMYTTNKSRLLSLLGLRNDEDIFIRIGDISIGNMTEMTETSDEGEYDVIKITRIKRLNNSVVQCETYFKMGIR